MFHWKKKIVGGVLGHGTQGTVCKAIDTRTGTFVAIKEIQLENNNPVAQIASISKENELLKQLNHPNIVKYITALRRDKYIYHVFEFIENGSLHDILLNFGVFTESLAVSLFFQPVLCFTHGPTLHFTHFPFYGAGHLCKTNTNRIAIFT